MCNTKILIFSFIESNINLKYLFIDQIKDDHDYSPKFQTDLKNNIFRLNSYEDFINFVKGDAYSLSSDDIKEYFKMILNKQYSTYIKNKDATLSEEDKDKLEQLVYLQVNNVNSSKRLFWPDLKKFITDAHNINNSIFSELFASPYLWSNILQEFDLIPPIFQKGIYSFVIYIKSRLKKIDDFDTFQEFKSYMDSLPSLLKEQTENIDNSKDDVLLPIADNVDIYLPEKILVGINANWPVKLYSTIKKQSDDDLLFPNQKNINDVVKNKDEIQKQYTIQQHRKFMNELERVKEVSKHNIDNDIRLTINNLIADVKYGIWTDGVWDGDVWNTGVWVNGVWLGGTWNDGTWEGGVWKNGIWKNGKWEKGIWYGGTWKNGEWDNGEWYNGVWLDGIWKNGSWHNGTWKNGEFNGGVFNRGLFENGIFAKNAIFTGGIFQGSKFYGLFLNGVWKTSFLNWYGSKWSTGKIFDDEYQYEFESKYNPREYLRLKTMINNQVLNSSKRVHKRYINKKNKKMNMINLISEVVISDNPEKTINYLLQNI